MDKFQDGKEVKEKCMDKFQDGKEVKEIRKISTAEAVKKMVGFRHDEHLYVFWRNVYKTLSQREDCNGSV